MKYCTLKDVYKRQVFLFGLLPAASGFAATAPDSLDAIDFAAIAGAELDASVNAYPLVNETLDLPSALSDGTAVTWSTNNTNAILLVKMCIRDRCKER